MIFLCQKFIISQKILEKVRSGRFFFLKKIKKKVRRQEKLGRAGM